MPAHVDKPRQLFNCPLQTGGNIEMNLHEEENKETPPSLDFELRSLNEAWASVLNAGAAEVMADCFTKTCVCCDPGSGHPGCPM